VFKKITAVPLNDSLMELEFHGHYSQYRWEILKHNLPVDIDAWASVIGDNG
jgi:hypothetical protein